MQNARRAGSADRSFQEEEEFFAKYEREEDEAARRQDSAVNPADDLTADQNDDTYTGYGVWHSSRQVRASTEAGVFFFWLTILRVALAELPADQDYDVIHRIQWTVASPPRAASSGTSTGTLKSSWTACLPACRQMRPTRQQPWQLQPL